MSNLSIGRKPVVWQPPGDCGKVTFYLRRSAPDELMVIHEVGAVKQEDADQVAVTLYQTVSGHVVAWSGVDDDDGNPAECTAENVLALLLDHPPAATLLWQHLAARDEMTRTVTRKNGYGDGSGLASPIPTSDADGIVSQTAVSTDAKH